MTDFPADVLATAQTIDAGFFTGHRGMYVEDIARAILAERERINALIEKKAQPFSDSRNPLASELVAALDDLRVCVTRGEVA